MWASSELSLFTTHFIKQVFVPQTPMSSITECVALVRFQCERVSIELLYNQLKKYKWLPTRVKPQYLFNIIVRRGNNTSKIR